jgi:F-type H+-transporting ATPase subunit alpha
VETLNQDQLSPVPVEDQVAQIYSGTGGYLDRIKTERISEFHEAVTQRLHSEQDDLMRKIADGEWDDSIEQQLGDAIGEAIDDFGPDFDEEGEPLEEGESDRIRDEDERRRPGRTAGEGEGEGEGEDGSSGESDDSDSGRGERETETSAA